MNLSQNNEIVPRCNVMLSPVYFSKGGSDVCTYQSVPHAPLLCCCYPCSNIFTLILCLEVFPPLPVWTCFCPNNYYDFQSRLLLHIILLKDLFLCSTIILSREPSAMPAICNHVTLQKFISFLDQNTVVFPVFEKVRVEGGGKKKNCGFP